MSSTLAGGQPPEPDAPEVKPAGLGKIQATSAAVSGIASGILALQSLVVLLFLSAREVGVLGIATGIGSLALVAQQFGVGAATLKEVAVAGERSTAYQTMLAGLVLRIAMTLPFSLVLVALSGWLATDVYGHPEIRGPVIIFAAIILLYGLVDVLAYTLQGLHLWTRFFAQKVVAAAVTAATVVVATAAFGLDGYFAGLLVAAVIVTATTAVFVAGAFGRTLLTTRPHGLRRRARAMLGLGIAAYVAKIFQVLALQAPILVAGYVESAEDTGALKVALTVGTVVLGLSGAVNTINIAVFSRRVARADERVSIDARRQVGLYAVLSAALCAAIAAVGPDVLRALDLGYADVGGTIVLGVVGPALFGILGIVVSTVYIPIGAYTRFVVVYLVPAAGAVGASLLAAHAGGGVEPFAAALVAGSAAGIAVAFADLARRRLLPPEAVAAVAAIAAVGLAGVLQMAEGARYALFAAAFVVSLVMFMRMLEARPR